MYVNASRFYPIHEPRCDKRCVSLQPEVSGALECHALINLLHKWWQCGSICHSVSPLLVSHLISMHLCWFDEGPVGVTTFFGSFLYWYVFHCFPFLDKREHFLPVVAVSWSPQGHISVGGGSQRVAAGVCVFGKLRFWGFHPPQCTQPEIANY